MLYKDYESKMSLDLLKVREDICDCGHSGEEHYSFEDKEGQLKPTHCDIDGCSCELFLIK